MKVLLIHTKFNYKSYDPPLGLLYIAAVLRQSNINVKILDTSFKGSLNEVFYEIEKYSPDVIGIYSMTIDMDYAIKISKFAKEKNIISVIGGPHATMLPYETIKYFDFVVRGEGEFTFLELIKALESKKDLREISGIIFKRNDKVIENKLREPIKNLDSLPFPARELIEMEKYINLFYWLDEIDINLRGTSLITSRGCPYNCAFCQPTLRKLFGERIRFRSVDNVIKEIEILISDYKINALHFYDDTFTFNKKWIREFCNKIKRYDVLWDCSTRVDQVNKEILKEMYRAGCRKIEFGVESGSQRILNNILRKGITLKQAEKAIKEAKEVGILTYVFFMIGSPTETIEDIKKTIEFINKTKPNEIIISITTLLPGTYLYTFSEQKNIQLRNWREYDYYKGGSLNLSNVPLWELKLIRKLILLKFYFKPDGFKFFLQHLKSLNGIRKLCYKLSRF
jgi:radical SAM superfamily enzyme YgiQ (UPF0313 family)